MTINTLYNLYINCKCCIAKIDISERIDVNKTSSSNACDICHYWYFLDKGFNFQPYISIVCHDILMMSMKLSNIAILNINGKDYRRIIKEFSKRESIFLL